MLVELIPVIEIGYNNQDIPAPTQYPYWEYPKIWNDFNAKSYTKAGFEDGLTPYLPGSSFYTLDAISDRNLVKIITDHTEDMRTGSGEQTSALFGGYALCIDGVAMYFPQCCGDLSDISYWKELTQGKENPIYEGHPAPIVKINNDTIVLDFTEEKYESFSPPPKTSIIEIDKAALQKAIEKAETELAAFAKRINTLINFNIDNLPELLIWTNVNNV